MKERRQFLSVLIRGGIVTSLAVLGGVFTKRWRDSDQCGDNFACGNCRLSDECRLPEADRFRLDEARGVKTVRQDGKPGKK
jgi:hypothetical protein